MLQGVLLIIVLIWAALSGISARSLLLKYNRKNKLALEWTTAIVTIVACAAAPLTGLFYLVFAAQVLTAFVLGYFMSGALPGN